MGPDATATRAPAVLGHATREVRAARGVKRLPGGSEALRGGLEVVARVARLAAGLGNVSQAPDRRFRRAGRQRLSTRL